MDKDEKGNTILRVLQVTQFLEIGGLESMVIGLSRQLNEKGVAVELICLNQVDEEYISVLKKENIPVHIIPEKGRLNFNYYRKVAAFIREKNFDVVHAHSGCHLSAALFAAMAGVEKLVYTAHGMLIFTRLRDRIEDSLAGMLTSHFVSVSDEIESAMKKWLWFPRCQFTTITNGIDTDRFRPMTGSTRKTALLVKYGLPEDRIIFGSVGRLATVKNYPMALKAVKRLVNSGITDICFVLVGEGAVGEGAQEQYLRDLVKDLNLSSHVRFLGMQYKIHEILPLFRFFILSSLTEGTSISLLEAQACGVPAVVTDVGGNSGVITHGVNGYLCPADDDEKMANHMRELIKYPELAQKMGKKGRERVERDFSVEAMTDKYLRIYLEK